MIARLATLDILDSLAARTLFTLDEVGDVSWKVAENAEYMPFFSCETYEVNLSGGEVLKFLGSFAVEFQVEISDDLMLLTYDQCCILQCQRVLNSRPPNEVPFSFLPALEEGYFSDGIIRAENGAEFKVHKTILTLAMPEMDWNSDPMPLSGFREDVVHMILHYIYSECLIKGLSEETAHAALQAAEGVKGLEKFSELCLTFLKNTALKQQIISLVTDIHACADRMVDLLNGKGSAETGSGSFGEPSLVLSPARLCYIIKQALREGAIAGAKLVILCDLFSRRKGDLSREERHEIIKYAKSRLPVFMNQLHRFFEVCKSHSSSMTAQQRQEIAAYLVPEIEITLDAMSSFVVEMKSSLEDIISQSSSSEKNSEKGHVKDVLGKALRNALHTRELIKLKRFHERTTKSFHNLMRKKENFCLMTQEEKVRSVSKNLEHLMDEVPLFLVRIEDVMSALDEKVSWREWKYLFKLGTSKVSWVLSKIQKHTDTVNPIFLKACEMVQRDQFTESISAIGLISKVTDGAGAAGGCVANKAASSAPKYAQLSSVESLCIPPYAQDSTLAAKALILLQKNCGETDVTFEIISTSEPGDIVISHADDEEISHQSVPKVITEIPAHRVIIASRCDWFRRALLSGMRESIDKKIPVHGTSPELFLMMLKYLYSGYLDTKSLSVDQLADLLSLSDGYEMDSLKCHCEYALNSSIDEESVLFLFSLADQYNARVLKESCLAFITLHVHLLYSDVFNELPDTLQKELHDKCDISWPSNQALSPEGGALGRHPGSSSGDMDEVMKALELGDVQASPQSTDSTSSSFLEDLHYVEDATNIEICLTELRGILGDEVPHEMLLRVASAADYQVNRAVNYYFSS
ncbi:hypothetical protein CAPTEDRAFT_219008 [Capitella teleta]|uniref:BTB domain-containing protein n=1 Tax=Capitella teleta TaxID=283909 RepID=R7UT16_CAPTE|nr:hypothetical protein CAPTEDRAFT_219008 [Capitella teleta]|eukprot:ELU06536.1 hypothetical protein CAPTEDRAFT_219008 [Capitella teleta]